VSGRDAAGPTGGRNRMDDRTNDRTNEKKGTTR
jgi:hypothetical protein